MHTPKRDEIEEIEEHLKNNGNRDSVTVPAKAFRERKTQSGATSF